MQVYGAVLEFLQARFGGPLREQESQVTVGLSVVTAAQRDPERVSLTFVNHGASELFIGVTPQVSTTNGIRLGPNGGTVSVSVEEDGTLPSAEWSAIGAAAGLTLYVLTVRRETALPRK